MVSFLRRLWSQISLLSAYVYCRSRINSVTWNKWRKLENPKFLDVRNKAPGLDELLNLDITAVQSRMLFTVRFKTVLGKD